MSYICKIPFHNSLVLGIMHLVPSLIKYLEVSVSMQHLLDEQRCLAEIRSRGLLLGFASVFLLVKSLNSSLVSEISQLCYGGEVLPQLLQMDFVLLNHLLFQAFNLWLSLQVFAVQVGCLMFLDPRMTTSLIHL